MSPIRRLFLTVIACVLPLAGLAPGTAASEGSALQAEVEKVIDAFAAGYAARDADAVMATFSERDDVMIYGTGADEKRVGLAAVRTQVERDFAQSDSGEIAIGWTHVSGSGNVAWAAIDGAFHVTAGEQTFDIPARMTLVLEKEKGHWKIVQGHFSTPAASQEEGESF